MDIKERLSERINIFDVRELILVLRGDDVKKCELFELMMASEDVVAYQAAWVWTHFPPADLVWLEQKQNELIDKLLSCRHSGMRRLILTLLNKQAFEVPPRVDFLDYCLQGMVSKAEPPAVQSLCMKIAYSLCRPIPELLQEFRMTLDLMENESTPAIQSSKRNILKVMARDAKSRK